MKLILNSSVARKVTGLLLVFFSQYNTVKNYCCALQEILINSFFTLKKELIKVIICNSDGINVENTGLKSVINQTTMISTYVKPSGYIANFLNSSLCLTSSIANNQLFTATNYYVAT